MSDFASSLPIRTENAGDAIVKVADATVTSQQLAVNADGSVNITDNGSSITVDGSVTVSATNLDIRDLVFATDKVDASGSSVTVSNTVAVSSTNLDIRDLVFATDKVDVTGSDVTVSNTVTVQSTNLDIRDLTHVSDSIKVGDGTDFLAVNADGSINVVITDGTPGTPVNDYNTVANVAGGATSTHTYTSTGNFNLTQIEASASGKLKIEVQVNGTTRFVQFNSASSPNLQIQLSQPIVATTGQTVTVIRTNRENQAQDVYSTISGYLA